MAKVKRKIPKKTKNLIILISAIVLALLLVGGFFLLKPLLFPVQAPEGDSGTDTPEGNEPTTPEIINTSPLPESTFLSSGSVGGFSYDLYEDYAVITKGDSTLTAPELPAQIEGKPIMAIGENAFSSCTLLSEITLPETLVLIDRCAFFGCGQLEKIVLPESVHEIGESAFADCTSLKNVTVTSGVKKLGAHAFDGTAFLKDQKEDFVILGDGILVAYNGDGGSITLPSDVKKVASLSSCETLTALYLPQSVTEIGDYALAGCLNLSSIMIPDSVKSIGEGAFIGCSMLTGVNVGQKLETLGTRAFAACDNLKSVGLPATLTSIGDNLFEDTSTIETIYVAPDSYAEEFFQNTEYASLVNADEA